jgi:hypothetical protein
MAERLNQCPACKSTSVETLAVHNPNTTNMNAKATLKCSQCSHTWEGHIASDHHKEQRRRGFVI